MRRWQMNVDGEVYAQVLTVVNRAVRGAKSIEINQAVNIEVDSIVYRAMDKPIRYAVYEEVMDEREAGSA